MGVLGELGDLGDGIRQGLADGVNETADAVGYSLDVVGLKSVGEKVRDGAEYVTGAAGAVVPERELGETDQPGELIHGSTGDLDDTVRQLKAFASAFENTGQALKKLDPSHWSGTAADSFRESFTAHPKRWLTAADACTAAAGALAEYAHTVSWARGQAAEAIEKWRAAEAQSATARQKYDQQVWEYESALAVGSLTGSKPGSPTDPGDFADPGATGREAAREILKGARHTRDSAAETATAKVTHAFAAAPAEPGTLAKLKAGLMDGTRAANMELEHFAGGFVKGGTGLIRMVRTVNPMDPYNLTHPSQYLQNVSLTGMGLLTAANHPVRTAKSLAGSGWSSDPSEALGTLTFDLVLDAVTGGAATGAGAARRTATGVAKDVMETAGERGTRDAVGATARDTGESAAEAASKSAGKGAPLPDSWTPYKHSGDVTDATADTAKDAAKDAARGKWDGDAVGSPDGSPASESGAGNLARDSAKHQSAMAEISDKAVTFDSNTAAEQYGAKHWNDYADSLPAEQKAAVHNYTGPGHSRINGFLREGEGSYHDIPEVRRHVEQLDKALAGNRLPEDVVVSRGTGLEHYLEKMNSSNPADMIGKDFTDDAYMSTSLGDAVFTNKGAVLHLRVPEGTEGLYVEQLGRYGAGERELLLGRGNEYTITEAFEDSNGTWQIYGKIHR